MQHKTNQLNKNDLFSSKNYQNIEQDFWVYKFEIDTSKVGYEYSLIDEIKQELPHVKSVVYLRGKFFYALFEKKNFKSKFDLEEQIEKLITTTDEVIFNLINCKDETEIDKRNLVQLLFNSLATSSKKSKCSNSTGGLYWIAKISSKLEESKDNVIWKYVTLKLEVDYHLHLKLDVKTFSNLLLQGKMDFPNRKKKLKDYPQYEAIQGDIRTMRRLKSDECIIPKSEEQRKNITTQQQEKERQRMSETYIIAQENNKKSSVPFLNISSWTEFEKSKSGILYTFLKEVEENLSNYVTIKFIESPFNDKKIEFNKKQSEEVKSKINEFYRNIPIVINIADSLKDDPKANQLAVDLQTFLTDTRREYKIPNVSIGDLSKKALNIRIIYNKQHYKRENINIKDEYLKDSNYLIHHITIDDFKIELEKTQKEETKILLSSAAIDVILKESYIKKDVKEGKITILNWNFGEWIFMDREETEDSTYKDEKYNFHLLKVSKNGSLEYDTCLYGDSFSNLEYESYRKTYEAYSKFNGREFLNGLLVSNSENVNLIFETLRFTIQEVNKIGRGLELEYEDDDDYLNNNSIIKIVDAFIESLLFREKDREKVLKLKELLADWKPNFSKKELIKKLKDADFGIRGEDHLQYRFCKFYEEQTDDVIRTFFRGKKNKKELLSSKLEVCYQIEENGKSAEYFVGEKSEGIQSSFQNATNIRKIKAVKNAKNEQSKLVFDEILETMSVDFVKHGGLTVLPFPFKYLREIRKLI